MKVDTSLWSEQAQQEFIEGWEDAGGYIDDLEGPSPWCCPWYYSPIINVNSRKPYDMGKEYWRRVKPEIEKELAQEQFID